MSKITSWMQVLEIFIDLVVAVIAEAIMAVPVMFAWNCVVPALTKLPELGYWQTFSLLILTLIAANAVKRSK